MSRPEVIASQIAALVNVRVDHNDDEVIMSLANQLIERLQNKLQPAPAERRSLVEQVSDFIATFAAEPEAEPEAEIVKLEITLQGETRTVEFERSAVRPDVAYSGSVFGCRVGNGTKIHRTSSYAYLENGEWKFHGWGKALNGTRAIRYWADNVNEPERSQHVGTSW